MMTYPKNILVVANTTIQWVQQPPAPWNVSAAWEQGQPWLTSSMNQEYFNHSHLPKVYELQKQKKFGKDTLYQLFTCDKSLLHIILHLYKSKFLVKTTGRAKSQSMTIGLTCNLPCSCITIWIWQQSNSFWEVNMSPNTGIPTSFFPKSKVCCWHKYTMTSNGSCAMVLLLITRSMAIVRNSLHIRTMETTSLFPRILWHSVRPWIRQTSASTSLPSQHISRSLSWTCGKLQMVHFRFLVRMTESSLILHSSFMHWVETSICVSTRTANRNLSLATLGSDTFNVSTTYRSHSPVLRFSCFMMMLWLCFAKWSTIQMLSAVKGIVTIDIFSYRWVLPLVICQVLQVLNPLQVPVWP